MRYASIALLLLIPSVAFAEAGAQDLRTFSLTVSPIHLAMPVLEAMGELRLGEDTGIAGIVGFGTFTVEDSVTEDKDTFDVIEVGGQINFYVLGDFDDGLHLGAEAMYLKLSGGEGDISGIADGLALGPYLGYKTTMDIGFTFVGQLGSQYVVAAAEAKDDSSGDEAKASDSSWIVLLNLNVGWSL